MKTVTLKIRNLKVTVEVDTQTMQQDQRALADQLESLIEIATVCKMYDAADFLNEKALTNVRSVR